MTGSVQQLMHENNIKKQITDLQKAVRSLQRKNVEADSLDQISPDGGTLASLRLTTTAGDMALDENGLGLDNTDMLDVNFWASIGVPSNVVSHIYALAFIGTKLYVGGWFSKIGGISAANIAFYDTVSGKWSTVGTGLNGSCWAMIAIGNDLYIGGNFTLAGGVANTAFIAKWNGANFTALSTGLNNYCVALAAIGSTLYLGGQFTLAGRVPNTAYIAKWDGANFTALGTGLNLYCDALAAIGTDLYIGGAFTLAGGVANTAKIAKWDGANFTALSTGLNDNCLALAAIGTDLYIGGAFTLAGGVPNTAYIAKWDGAAFTALDIGLNNICFAMVVIGTDLYLGGQFNLAGGIDNTAHIAKWDGAAYSPLGVGLNGTCYALAVIGNDLYLGGDFTTAGGRASKLIAAYLCTLQSVLAYLEISCQALQDSLVLGTIIITDPAAAQNPATKNYADNLASSVGVTNGNSHDHVGGDGAQIQYSSLGGTPTIPSTAIGMLLGHGNNTVVASGATAYAAPGYFGTNATRTNVYMIAPCSGTLKNFRLRTNSAQSAGGTLVITVRANNSDTPIVITIGAGAAAAAWSDTTHTASIAAGQSMEISIVNNGSGNSAQIGAIDIEFDTALS